MPKTYRTYYDKTTGAYLGSYRGPDETNPYDGNPSVEGQRSGLTRWDGSAVVDVPAPEPEPTSGDRIEALEKALIKKGTVSRAEIDAERPVKPRAERL